MSLEWTERYSVYTARLRVGDLVVAWDRGAYAVSAFGVRLKEASASVEDGKRRAENLARKLLAEASAALETETA